MRVLPVVVLIVAALTAPAAAQAADPVMPLSELREGMKCTGKSVFHAQAVEDFDVEILDVVGESAAGTTQPRILIRVSGEKVDATGVGPGFSGSPFYCTGEDGVVKSAGAISETIGQYGGKVVLATPMEQIVGTPVDAPEAKVSRRDARLLARARPLAAPITIGGLDKSLMKGLQAAAARRDIALFPAPTVPADTSPEVPMIAGSAMGVGLSSGDITISGTGTVSYIDGDKLWAYGHQFDGAGKRSLLLQDAYVAAIIDNPVQVEGYITYKLSGAVRDRGIISNDSFDAVAGRLGTFPATTTVRVYAEDADRDLQREMRVNVASEADVDNPTGFTALSYVAPLAVSQGAADIIGSAPQRMSGSMCMQVTLRELAKPLRFCNRYINDGTGYGETVGVNPVALEVGSDATSALSIFDGYKGKPVHVEEVTARLTQTRAQRQAYLRSIELPKRIRRGSTVNAKIVARVVRGPLKTFRFKWRVPLSLKSGRKTLDFRGVDPDGGFGFFEDIIIELFGDEEDSYYDSEGPRSVKTLARQFRALKRWDGIATKRGQRFYRDDTYRIGGRAKVKVRVLPRR